MTETTESALTIATVKNAMLKSAATSVRSPRIICVIADLEPWLQRG